MTEAPVGPAGRWRGQAGEGTDAGGGRARRIFQRLVLQCRPVTGAAPIYLVSACASGEEFVAAFRRYADRSGLFIPISQPLATGRRSRFAVTLKDGGVMIEGEAEVISSAMTASVLHGRVGMTLRFIAPDDASKTTLGELERARLAMKPPPPTIPPRPAEIPDEPRPVPPPIQGRIDAVNALAECVAIGDPEPPLPLAAPARSGLKTMTGVPPLRPRSPSAPPPASSTPSRGAPPTGSPPVATPDRAEPPASSKPAPADGAPVGERGPISDTYITAMPPTPTELDLASPVAPRLASEMPVAVPRTPTKPGVAPAATPAAPGPIAHEARDSETMTAVPTPRPATPSSPTEIGVVIADLAPRDPAIPIIEGVHDDPSARTQVSGSAPTPEPASPGEPQGAAAPDEPPPPAGPLVAPQRVAAPEVEIAEPTDLSAGPPDPTTPVRSPEVMDAPRSVPASLLPGAQDAGELAETTETAEIAEPQGASPDRAAAPADDAPPASHAPAPPSDEAGLRSRRTVLGIAPARRRATPAPADAAVAAPAIPATPVMRKAVSVSVSDDARAIHHATARAAPPVPVSPELTPVDGWTMPADVPITYSTPPSGSAPGMPLPGMPVANVPGASPPIASPPVASPPVASLLVTPGAATPDTPVEAHAPAIAAAAAAAAATAPRPGSAASPVLPSGDWTIARDPEAPDGWSAPFTSGPAHHLGEPRPPLPPVVASAEPLDANAAQPSLRPDEMPVLEPKVQIDPTLIEPVPGQLIDPLPVMPAHEAYPMAPPPGLPGYGMAGALAEAPPMNMMMAVPQASPYLMPQAAPMHPSMPGYGIDPGYQMHGMPVPHDAQYASDHALRAATARRRAIIVLVAALTVVLIGIVVLLVRGDSHRRPASTSGGAAPLAPASRTSSRAPQSAAPVAADTARAEPAAPGAPAATDTPSTPAADGVPAADTAPASNPAPSAPSPAGAIDTATARPGGECFADVTSVPIGADIVIDQTNVIGMTPDRVELPCGAPVELLIRKGRLVSATRTITPTPDGAKVKVTLTRQTMLVRVSSTPPGATITLYGRPLGVTPTTVKVPAFESSTLTITKDGYGIASERVAPKVNGTAVHTTLTRLERNRR